MEQTVWIQIVVTLSLQRHCTAFNLYFLSTCSFFTSYVSLIGSVCCVLFSYCLIVCSCCLVWRNSR